MTQLIPNSLSISCVYYDTDMATFEKTLLSIVNAVNIAKECKTLEYSELHLINNNPEKETLFFQFIEKQREQLGNAVIHNGHGNIGYGRANNIAIHQTQCTYHLILNPDVITDSQAIKNGVEYLNLNPHVGLVVPSVKDENGEVEYLAKRMPTFLVIFLRGLNNKLLNKIFEKKLAHYAYQDKIPADKPLEIELASGCFMLCRTEILKKVDGFSYDYFLYFEDFDLSKKITRLSKIHHLPNMNIVHLGGHTGTKSSKHKIYFFKSYLTFYRNQK
ncbi:MAG: glycosyltransferase [Gammaproteobacteria bacterium]|nr:MAG: glycosyltransferase [Gammaproteobacteria bacterium]